MLKTNYGLFLRLFNRANNCVKRGTPQAAQRPLRTLADIPQANGRQEAFRRVMRYLVVGGADDRVTVDAIAQDLVATFGAKIQQVRRDEVRAAVASARSGESCLAFEAAVLLAKTIRELESAGEVAPIEVDTSDCMFCRGTDSREFRGQEHSIAQAAIGITRAEGALLPRGWVCDPCNGGVLGQLVQELLRLPNIGIGAVCSTCATEDGTAPPDYEVTEGTFHQMDIDRVEFRPVGGKPPRHFALLPGYSLGETFTPKVDADWKKVGRAVLMMAMGLLAKRADARRDEVLGAEYDIAREFITGKRRDFDGFLVMEIGPVDAHVTIGGNPMAFAIRIFGITFRGSLKPGLIPPIGHHHITWHLQHALVHVLDLRTSAPEPVVPSNLGMVLGTVPAVRGVEIDPSITRDAAFTWNRREGRVAPPPEDGTARGAADVATKAGTRDGCGAGDGRTRRKGPRQGAR
ncbi:MAG: hypothetical protein U0166_02605 [Acidobacteriota bacterium]